MYEWLAWIFLYVDFVVLFYFFFQYAGKTFKESHSWDQMEVLLFGLLEAIEMIA